MAINGEIIERICIRQWIESLLHILAFTRTISSRSVNTHIHILQTQYRHKSKSCMKCAHLSTIFYQRKSNAHAIARFTFAFPVVQPHLESERAVFSINALVYMFYVNFHYFSSFSIPNTHSLSLSLSASLVYHSFSHSLVINKVPRFIV